jgi:hypothetical protein
LERKKNITGRQKTAERKERKGDGEKYIGEIEKKRKNEEI